VDGSQGEFSEGLASVVCTAPKDDHGLGVVFRVSPEPGLVVQTNPQRERILRRQASSLSKMKSLNPSREKKKRQYGKKALR